MLLLLLQIIFKPRLQPSYPFILKYGQLWLLDVKCNHRIVNMCPQPFPMLGNTATFFPVGFKARCILPHDLSAKGKMSQKNVWFPQERADSCWQLRKWSWRLSTPITSSILRPKSPRFTSLTIWSQPPGSHLAMPGIRWFKVLQKLTLEDEHLGPHSLPWVSTTTVQVGGRRSAFATARRFPRFECCLGCSWRQNENVFLTED